jgi:ABC-type polysaccharide/polyol phosphate export permease
MGLRISNLHCKEDVVTESSSRIDRARVKFVIRRRIKGMAGRRKLGAIWLILHPIFLSLVYLFVFTVIRSSPNAVNLFIGISMFNMFSSSIRSGVNSVRDFSGGIKAERVSTRVISQSMWGYRLIDVLLQSLGVSLILIFGLGVGISGIVSFIVISLVMGILAEGVALNISLITRRIPDVSNFIDYALLLIFFGSPVLYPISITSGLHYQINSYNPISFFIEFVRYFSGIEESFWEIFGFEAKIIMAVLVALSIRGYSTLDRFRWEVSNWS